MGKKLSFTFLALATFIAASALSAPKVPHMSSMVMATRAVVGRPVADPLRERGQQPLERVARRDRREVGVGGRTDRATAVPPLREQPELRGDDGTPGEPTPARNCRREIDAATATTRVGTPR